MWNSHGPWRRTWDDIAEGEASWVAVIDDFYKDFEPQVERADEEMEKIEIKDEPAGEDCEKCGSPMVYKMGRYGKFMACSNFPGLPQYEGDRQNHRREMSEVQ